MTVIRGGGVGVCTVLVRGDASRGPLDRSLGSLRPFLSPSVPAFLFAGVALFPSVGGFGALVVTTWPRLRTRLTLIAVDTFSNVNVAVSGLKIRTHSYIEIGEVSFFRKKNNS